MKCPECDSERVRVTSRSDSNGINEQYTTVWYKCQDCGKTFSDLEDNETYKDESWSMK